MQTQTFARPTNVLLFLWRALTALFFAISCWALFIQLTNDNPPELAVVPFLAFLAALFFAITLRTAVREELTQRLRYLAAGSALFTLTLAPLWAVLAQVDDAPGAMVIGLLFFAMGVLSLYTCSKPE